MLKITFIEFILKGIPEAFLFMLAAFAFTNTRFSTKKYLITSLLMGVIAYFVRLLPINYGVHTILCLFFFILISVWILGIDYFKTIKTTVIIFIIQFICEGINIFIIQVIMHKELELIMNNPIDKIIYSTPSTIFFAIIVCVYYFISKKKVEKI